MVYIILRNYIVLFYIFFVFNLSFKIIHVFCSTFRADPINVFNKVQKPVLTIIKAILIPDFSKKQRWIDWKYSYGLMDDYICRLTKNRGTLQGKTGGNKSCSSFRGRTICFPNKNVINMPIMAKKVPCWKEVTSLDSFSIHCKWFFCFPWKRINCVLILVILS